MESCDADLAEVTMRCIAERVTWTNQRKIKRLKAKLPHSSYVLPGICGVYGFVLMHQDERLTSSGFCGGYQSSKIGEFQE